jgi:CBS-domain-containing membrane protein
LAFALGVGLAMAAMLLTGTVHPPAGADPIVVILASASWPFLFMPVLVGMVGVVLLGAGFHRWVTGKSIRSPRPRLRPAIALDDDEMSLASSTNAENGPVFGAVLEKALSKSMRDVRIHCVNKPTG